MDRQHARSGPVGSVLLVTPVWARDGGIATHVACSAAALAGAGVRVDVLVGEIHSEETPPGVALHLAPRLSDRDAPVQERLGPALGLEPEVAHLHRIDHPELVAQLRPRAPTLISVHGYSACTAHVYHFGPGQECHRAHGPGCFPNLLLRGCAHMLDPRPFPGLYRDASRALEALRACDLTLSYSSAVDRHLARNGLTDRRIVPLFTTVKPADGAGHERRRRVVYAGRLVASKGVDTLIRAARRLPDAQFAICGEGWQEPKLRRLAERLGVAERIDFKGWLAPEELARELAEASVVAIPSVWPEPFGLVGIEALAAGRPVVASATGGIEDWLDDGVSGLLFEAGDADSLADRLAELLADPARQARMGEAGRRAVAERFTAQRHVAALLDAYAAARDGWQRSGTQPLVVPG